METPQQRLTRLKAKRKERLQEYGCGVLPLACAWAAGVWGLVDAFAPPWLVPFKWLFAVMAFFTAGDLFMWVMPGWRRTYLENRALKQEIKALEADLEG